MTDSEMKNILEKLSNDDTLNDLEIAIGMLVAINMSNQEEVYNGKTVVSER